MEYVYKYISLRTDIEIKKIATILKKFSETKMMPLKIELVKINIKSH